MRKLLPALAIMATGACNSNSQSESGTTNQATTTSNMAEDTTKGKWITLFDGKTQAGWHGYNRKDELKNWIVEDGALVCIGGANRSDIVTDKEYENFEFSWDWKMSKGGNSGVMYHVVEKAEYQSTWQTGPEYQLLDDAGYKDKLEESQKSGADYAMYPTNSPTTLKVVGEWNNSKIIFNNGHVEHWLNGQKVLEFEAWSDDWSRRKAAGKWKDHSSYGMAKKGRIALQDHGDKVSFKNIMIKEL